MSEGGAEELPPVVAALTGNDEDFLAMLERDIAAAAGFREDLQAMLSGAGTIGESESGAALGLDASGANEEAAQAQAAAERISEAAAETEAYFEQIGAVTRETFAEAEASAAQELELLRTLSAEATAAGAPGVGEEAAVFEQVGTGAMTAQEAVAELTVTEEEAAAGAKLVAEEAQAAATSTEAVAAAAGASTGALRAMTGSAQAAAAALEVYGTSEAQATLAAAALSASEDDLAVANELLIQTYASLELGGTASLGYLQNAMQDLADAQAQVVASTQAVVEAETQVNLAVIQNETALVNEAAAMRDLQAAATMTGMDLAELSAELEAGNFAVLDKAAADAKATLTSTQLAEADQQLAAANLTLIGTFQRLAEGENVSSEAQAAALGGVKSAESDVKSLAGSTGELEGAAKGAASGMGSMGAIMYGPLGMAAFAAMSFLPMLGGMFSSNAVSASAFTQAVSQDSNAVGDNTAATIQSTLQKSNLLDISQQLGVSQAQLIEYAAGETQAQQQVTAAYNAKETALTKANDAQVVHDKYQGTTQYDTTQQTTLALTREKTALDEVTASVQQAIQQDQANSDALLAAEQTTQIYNASVAALGSQQLLNIQNTQMSNQATVEYGDRMLAAESTAKFMAAAVGAAGVQMELQQHATEITNMATVQYGDAVMGAYRDATMFNTTLDAAYVSMQEQAQASSMASVGVLNLGDSQSSLNRQLVDGENLYTQAQQGATAYGAALSSLNGSMNTLLGSEAAFTTSLGGLTTAVQSNGESLDVNSTKGAANITVVTGIATAAQAAAVAVYQNDVANGNASSAYQDATDKLQQEKEAFITAADKAHLNKDAVKALADELFKLPPKITTDLNVNTSQAVSNLDALNSLLAKTLSAEGSVGTNATVAASAYAHSLDHIPHRAGGGGVEQGMPYWVNETGKPEIFVPGASGFITPAEMLPAATVGAGGGYAPSYAAGGGYGQPPDVHVTVLVDGHEVAAVIEPSMRAGVQQYRNMNSLTGFG